MDAGMNERLQMVASSLADHIKLLESCGFDETARLIAIAKLDLQIKINGFSIEEMDQFYSELEVRAEDITGAPSKPLPRTKTK